MALMQRDPAAKDGAGDLLPSFTGTDREFGVQAQALAARLNLVPATARAALAMLRRDVF